MFLKKSRAVDRILFFVFFMGFSVNFEVKVVKLWSILSEPMREKKSVISDCRMFSDVLKILGGSLPSIIVSLQQFIPIFILLKF